MMAPRLGRRASVDPISLSAISSSDVPNAAARRDTAAPDSGASLGELLDASSGTDEGGSIICAPIQDAWRGSEPTKLGAVVGGGTGDAALPCIPRHQASLA